MTLLPSLPPNTYLCTKPNWSTYVLYMNIIRIFASKFSGSFSVWYPHVYQVVEELDEIPFGIFDLANEEGAPVKIIRRIFHSLI
jgi:hypothetical protein